MTMGERIQSLRTGCGLSQEQLAGLVGVSRQAVSKWERSEAIPDTNKLAALARGFGDDGRRTVGRSGPRGEAGGVPGCRERLPRVAGHPLALAGRTCLPLGNCAPDSCNSGPFDCEPHGRGGALHPDGPSSGSAGNDPSAVRRGRRGRAVLFGTAHDSMLVRSERR